MPPCAADRHQEPRGVDVKNPPVLLNFGCGSIQPEGWVNVDRSDFGQAHVEDAERGLSFADDTFDGVMCNHSLQENGYHELPVVLAELRRILKPGGTIRVLWPDLNAAFAAYKRGDRAWFPIGDDEPTLDDKFSCYISWFGSSRTLCTERRLVTLLTRAGFVNVKPAQYGTTRLLALALLDDREPEEQLIVEADSP